MGKGMRVGDLFNSAEAWRGITWGLVKGFGLWMQHKGYALGSVAVRFATVKRYAALAVQSGIIDANEGALIKSLRPFTNTRNVDAKRARTRLGAKKAHSTDLTLEQRKTLKERASSTPQSACYALLMCLLLDHGLRVSEVILLTDANVDTTLWTLSFYRPKVDRHDIHRMTQDTIHAYLAYKPFIIEGEKLLRQSERGGALGKPGLTRGGVEQIVKRLGKNIGVPSLSPHDCRHSWATEYEKKHTPFELRDAGGWNSLDMPNRYVNRKRISNQGEDLE